MQHSENAKFDGEDDGGSVLVFQSNMNGPMRLLTGFVS
jgi:hypothetical protein